MSTTTRTGGRGTTRASRQATDPDASQAPATETDARQTDADEAQSAADQGEERSLAERRSQGEKGGQSEKGSQAEKGGHAERVSHAEKGGHAEKRGQAEGGSGEPAGEAAGDALVVPVVLPWLHVSRLRLPSPMALASRAGAVRERLPEPRRVVYYGGLTALAALGVVEWPVAAAVAAGVWVASRARSDQDRTPSEMATTKA
jgi:hypothetical protein